MSTILIFSSPFGLLNIRSLHHKVDDVLDIRRELSVDVLLLVETWHDPDSVCISRDPEQLSPNHGGVAVISANTVLLSVLPITVNPTTFEYICVRLSFRSSLCVIVVIYHYTLL